MRGNICKKRYRSFHSNCEASVFCCCKIGTFLQRKSTEKGFFTYNIESRLKRCCVKTFLMPLSPEEEADCLNRLKDGEQRAKEELVLHNMRLVAHVAKRYAGFEEDMDDLISIGTIGLMKAVDSFRPEYGNKFATYAIRCVDNELLMYLRAKKKQRKEVSMFEPIGTDKEGNQIQLVDVLEFHDKNVADEVATKEQMKKIRNRMKDVLTERENFIICHRYGMEGKKELTQREIARALGISRSYVSRIEKRALEKLKEIIGE